MTVFCARRKMCFAPHRAGNEPDEGGKRGVVGDIGRREEEGGLP